MSVVDWKNGSPKDIHSLIFEICEYYFFLGGGNFLEGKNKFKDIEMGR